MLIRVSLRTVNIPNTSNLSKLNCSCFDFKNLILALFLMFFANTAMVNDAQAQGAIDGTVTLNFLDSNLEDIVKGISAMTGKKFLVSNELKSRKINLVSDRPIAVGKISDFLLTTLRSQRLTIIESDGIYTIVPETDAWSQATPIKPKSPDSEMVSKLFRFKNSSATSAANIIRPFLSQKGFPLVPDPRQNTLIVVDYANNLRNLEILIRSIDEADNILPVIFPVTHISASEAENSLKNMLYGSNNITPANLQAGQASTNNEQIIADYANNRLLIRADGERLAYISKLLSFIDVPRENSSNIHIYQLKYANAEAIAKSLSGILSSNNNNKTSASQVLSGQPQGNQNSQNSQQKGGGGVAKSNGSVIEVSNSEGINIQADPATNSIIVLAPEVVYRNIVDILQKLDVRRRQIFVEVLIAEIQGDRTDEFSVQWMNAKGLDNSGNNTTGFGGTNLGKNSILDVAKNPANLGKGLNVGLLKGTVTIPGIGKVLNLGMLANALEQRLSANILSSPNLLVLNNEESKLSVGSNVPIVTGQYTNTTSGNSSPFQTIERKDVGVTLKLKPQIMDSGVILLDIFQEVSDVTTVTAQGPTTSQRSIESRVLLNDGQTVVLGGLINEKTTDIVSKVPILGDIPIIGALFRSTSKEHKKANLLLFLRPTILRDEHEVTELSTKKYQELQGKMPYTGDDLRGIFSTPDPVVLPSLPDQPRTFQSFTLSLPESVPSTNNLGSNKINIDLKSIPSINPPKTITPDNAEVSNPDNQNGSTESINLYITNNPEMIIYNSAPSTEKFVKIIPSEQSLDSSNNPEIINNNSEPSTEKFVKIVPSVQSLDAKRDLFKKLNKEVNQNQF